MTDVRHQFGDDWADPDGPLLPSERRRLSRAGARESVPMRCVTVLPGRSSAGCPPGRDASRRTGCATSAPRPCMPVAWISRLSRSSSVTSGSRPRPATSTSTRTTSSTPGRSPTSGWPPASAWMGGELMRWNLRMAAAERGIWKSTEMRRRLADARPGDQRREDVGAVDWHPDLDPARRPRRDLCRPRVQPDQPAHL